MCRAARVTEDYGQPAQAAEHGCLRGPRYPALQRLLPVAAGSLIPGDHLAETARNGGDAQRREQMCVQLAKLIGHQIVVAGELPGAQPQRPVPEVIINRRERRDGY